VRLAVRLAVRLTVRLTVTTIVSCLGKVLLVRVRRVRCMCPLLVVLLRRWVFTMGSEVNGTSDQGITYNMADHMGLESSAVL
jgi:hypothetical protein